MQLEFDPIVSRNQVFAIEKIIMEETSSPEKIKKKGNCPVAKKRSSINT